MENWELDFYWNKARHWVKDNLKLDKLPDLNGILFLIGVQELGRWDDNFSKEDKQNLMHVAVCELLSRDGYYEFVGRDAEGWPHYKHIRAVSERGLDNQEELLKRKVIDYFEILKQEEN